MPSDDLSIEHVKMQIQLLIQKYYSPSHHLNCTSANSNTLKC